MNKFKWLINKGKNKYSKISKFIEQKKASQINGKLSKKKHIHYTN